MYPVRWRLVGDALSELALESVEAEVLWGDDVRERLRPLHKTVGELRVAIVQNLQLRSKKPPPMKLEKIEEIDRIIFEINEDPEKDEFTARIQAAVDEIQDFVQPKLKL